MPFVGWVYVLLALYCYMFILILTATQTEHPAMTLTVRKTEVTPTERPALFAEGVRAYMIVSSSHGKHSLFYRMQDGRVDFRYGSEPTPAMFNAARGI